MITQSILHHPVRLLQCTGLTMEQFQFLSLAIFPLWINAEINRLSYTGRKKAIGQGHPYSLKTIEEKLFAILLWYKTYCPFWMLGMMVGIDESNAYRLIMKLRPLIQTAADPKLKSYFTKVKREQKKLKSLKELKEKFPEIYDLLIDVTEQERTKPERQQKKYYSGKKKKHTLKTQIVVGKSGLILHVSKTYPGHVHDYKLFKREKMPEKIPKGVRSITDRGYDGANKDFPDLDITTPIKRNRWKRILTRSEKIHNTRLSRRRILIEHILSRLKKYRLLSETFRNRIKNYNQDFRNIAAIINFRHSYT